MIKTIIYYNDKKIEKNHESFARAKRYINTKKRKDVVFMFNNCNIPVVFDYRK